MKSFETSTTVQPLGDVLIAGVPFAPGTEVEVTISPRRAGAVEFTQAWERLCHKLRSLPHVQSISEAEIQQEINGHRAGQ